MSTQRVVECIDSDISCLVCSQRECCLNSLAAALDILRLHEQLIEPSTYDDEDRKYKLFHFMCTYCSIFPLKTIDGWPFSPHNPTVSQFSLLSHLLPEPVYPS